MGYVDSNLIPGEQVVYRGRIHWAILLPGILLIPILIGVYFLIRALVVRATTEMAVTNKRVVIKTGLITRNTLEMNLVKIENIGVNQGLIARLFNFGVVTVVGTGGTRESFRYVAAPLDFRHAVQAQIDARGRSM